MRRALRLAAHTSALASPNPQVGCVLTRDNVLLAEGAHLYQTRDHAEIVALQQARSLGRSTVGATAYVTLEPCAHHGRTPPCADALIAARIARAVVATVDPNPLVSGQGLQKLRAAGIAVTLGVEQQPARDLNNPFAFAIQHRRPFVTLKAALSADEKLAPANQTPNQTHWITGPAAREHVHHLRHASDAILTGIGTALADNPSLTDRSGLPRRRPLQRILLDTHLRIPLTSNLVQTADPSQPDLWIFSGPETAPDRLNALQSRGIRVTTVPADPHLSLPAILTHLHEAQLTSVLLEAGSSLNGAFLAHDLVDQLVLFYAPTELGESAIPFAQGIASPSLLHPQLIRPTHQTFGMDACITGLLHDPWKLTTDN